MNKLPKDVLIEIHRYIHRQNIIQLNEEYKIATSHRHGTSIILFIKNYKTFIKWITNDNILLLFIDDRDHYNLIIEPTDNILKRIMFLHKIYYHEMDFIDKMYLYICFPNHILQISEKYDENKQRVSKLKYISLGLGVIVGALCMSIFYKSS